MAINPDGRELNYFTIRGVNSPGRCRISGADRTFRWDEAEGQGIIARLRLRGLKLARFTIAVDMWMKEQLVEWELFTQALLPPELLYGGAAGYKKTLSGTGIDHPILAAAGITAVVLETIGQLTLTKGIWTSELKFIEYRPVQAVPVGKVDRSVPAVRKGPVVTAQSEADKALVEGRAKAEKARVAAGGTPTPPGEEGG